MAAALETRPSSQSLAAHCHPALLITSSTAGLQPWCLQSACSLRAKLACQCFLTKHQTRLQLEFDITPPHMMQHVGDAFRQALTGQFFNRLCTAHCPLHPSLTAFSLHGQTSTSVLLTEHQAESSELNLILCYIACWHARPLSCRHLCRHPATQCCCAGAVCHLPKTLHTTTHITEARLTTLNRK